MTVPSSAAAAGWMMSLICDPKRGASFISSLRATTSSSPMTLHALDNVLMPVPGLLLIAVPARRGAPTRGAMLESDLAGPSLNRIPSGRVGMLNGLAPNRFGSAEALRLPPRKRLCFGGASSLARDDICFCSEGQRAPRNERYCPLCSSPGGGPPGICLTVSLLGESIA